MQFFRPYERRAISVLGIGAIAAALSVIAFMAVTKAIENFIRSIDLKALAADTLRETTLLIFKLEAQASGVLLLPVAIILLALIGYAYSVNTLKIGIAMANAESGTYKAPDIQGTLKKRYDTQMKIKRLAEYVVVMSLTVPLILFAVRLIAIDRQFNVGTVISVWLSIVHVFAVIVACCLMAYLSSDKCVEAAVPKSVKEQAFAGAIWKSRLYHLIHNSVAEFFDVLPVPNYKLIDYAFYVFGMAAHKHGVYREIISADQLATAEARIRLGAEAYVAKADELKVADPTIKIDLSR